MAANSTAVWRVRPSGNNNNGGGFDCSISAAATGTHGSFTGTTFTDATAAAFTAGMVGSSINIAGIGQYKITARIDASNITLGSGNPALTLASPLSWTVGSGQDYSQQNAAQLSQSSTANTSTATTTLTDTGAAFTTAVIGNGIWVSGTGITTTYTFITARPSATTLTLQTSPGTTGTAVSYNIGGGWATHANVASTGPLAGLNTVYFLGSGTPNPASYTYDFDLTSTITTGSIDMTIANDPATPGYKAPPDTTGGMPVIKFDVAGNLLTTANNTVFINGLWFVGTATNAAGNIVIRAGGFSGNNGQVAVLGCVLDQFNQDITLVSTASNGMTSPTVVIGCEVFSSVAGTAGVNYAITGGRSSGIIYVIGCNVHDCKGIGVGVGNVGMSIAIFDTIVAKCNSVGVQNSGTGAMTVKNCTIDGNLGDGVRFDFNSSQLTGVVINNIISNQAGVGKYGINVVTPTGGGVVGFLDYNTFYNNTVDLHNTNYGPHDTHGGSNPYVGQSTENYSLG